MTDTEKRTKAYAAMGKRFHGKAKSGRKAKSVKSSGLGVGGGCLR